MVEGLMMEGGGCGEGVAPPRVLICLFYITFEHLLELERVECVALLLRTHHVVRERVKLAVASWVRGGAWARGGFQKTDG